MKKGEELRKRREVDAPLMMRLVSRELSRHNAALHGDPRLTPVTHVGGRIADVTLSSQERRTVFSMAERTRV